MPVRRPKGEAVALPGYDLRRLDELMSHPVSAWLSWGQGLAPTPERFAALQLLLDESPTLARSRWEPPKSRPSGRVVKCSSTLW